LGPVNAQVRAAEEEFLKDVAVVRGWKFDDMALKGADYLSPKAAKKVVRLLSGELLRRSTLAVSVLRLALMHDACIRLRGRWRGGR